VKALCSLTGLDTLSLCNNRLDAEGASALECLTALVGLRDLDLAVNGLGDQGVAALSWLQCLTTLESLNLANNKLGSGVGRVFSVLVDMHALRRLKLGDNDLGVDGVISLSSLTVLQGVDCFPSLTLDAWGMYTFLYARKIQSKLIRYLGPLYILAPMEQFYSRK